MPTRIDDCDQYSYPKWGNLMASRWIYHPIEWPRYFFSIWLFVIKWWPLMQKVDFFSIKIILKLFRDSIDMPIIGRCVGMLSLSCIKFLFRYFNYKWPKIWSLIRKLMIISRKMAKSKIRFQHAQHGIHVYNNSIGWNVKTPTCVCIHYEWSRVFLSRRQGLSAHFVGAGDSTVLELS